MALCRLGTTMSDTKFVVACQTSELDDGATKPVDLGGTPVLLCRTQDRIYAVINKCSHAEEKLECGRMRRGWIACPVHGARFDLETGEPLNPPATQPIRTFEVRIVDGMIEVAV
jgi:3-phenylpropionate/trans-cinnamate dioxygenase ferredoxin component